MGSSAGSARANIRSYVSRLRDDLDRADHGLSRRLYAHDGDRSGYGLEVRPDECDATRFVLAAGDGAAQVRRDDPESAVDTLESATALWRGSFGPALPRTRWFKAHVDRLNGARMSAYENLFTACILAGRTTMLSSRIEVVLAEDPYRPRLWELLAAGHCAERNVVAAGAAVRRCGILFVDHLGLDLPPSLVVARSAALDQDYDLAVRSALGRT